MASRPIFQFYAELDDFKPKIWRRFQVLNSITVARLGYILQVLYEMKASHLMSFEVPFGDNYVGHYEIIDDDYEQVSDLRQNTVFLDAAKERICQAVSEPGEKLSFEYDFGDNWQVSLTLENVFSDRNLSGRELPRVLEGVGFGIVEDVGGVSGLHELVKAYKRRKGAGYRGYCTWLGVKDFDIAAFDLDDMNYRLKKLPRIYRQIYEDGLEPTQRSIDLIEREYLRNIK